MINSPTTDNLDQPVREFVINLLRGFSSSKYTTPTVNPEPKLFISEVPQRSVIKVSIVKAEDNYLEVIVQGETYTLFAPLIEYLLKRPDVEYAMYDIDHPLTQNVRFKIKTKGRPPLDVIKETVNEILRDIEDLERGFLGSG
jgi:DNA-directed RNA polymerase subunit L